MVDKLKSLRINFVDFWGDLVKTDNYFYNLLSTEYNVVIDEESPDLIFFSVGYGNSRQRDKYKNHNCPKIFFTGENVRPNFLDHDVQSGSDKRYTIGSCDLAFTFDYSDDPRNYRFPLWAFFTNWFNKPYIHERDPAYLVPVEHLLSRQHNKPKTKFCNFIFSHDSGPRVNILTCIEHYKSVDSAGSLANNTNFRVQGRGDQKQKIDFISDYKFTIASENAKHDGYTTEKILHPLSVGSIPIYWGSDRVVEDFNPDAFINITDDMISSELLDKIQKLDTDKDEYEKMINTPVFKDNNIPESVLPKNVLKFIESVL